MQCQIRLSTLNLAQVRPVDAGALRELLLAEAQLLAVGSNSIAELASRPGEGRLEWTVRHALMPVVYSRFFQRLFI